MSEFGFVKFALSRAQASSFSLKPTRASSDRSMPLMTCLVDPECAVALIATDQMQAFTEALPAGLEVSRRSWAVLKGSTYSKGRSTNSDLLWCSALGSAARQAHATRIQRNNLRKTRRASLDGTAGGSLLQLS